MNHEADYRNWNLISEANGIREWRTDPYRNVFGDLVYSECKQAIVADEWVIIRPYITGREVGQ